MLAHVSGEFQAVMYLLAVFLVLFTAVFLILAIRRLDSDRLGG